MRLEGYTGLFVCLSMSDFGDGRELTFQTGNTQ